MRAIIYILADGRETVSYKEALADSTKAKRFILRDTRKSTADDELHRVSID